MLCKDALVKMKLVKWSKLIIWVRIHFKGKYVKSLTFLEEIKSIQEWEIGPPVGEGITVDNFWRPANHREFQYIQSGKTKSHWARRKRWTVNSIEILFDHKLLYKAVMFFSLPMSNKNSMLQFYFHSDFELIFILTHSYDGLFDMYNSFPDEINEEHRVETFIV